MNKKTILSATAALLLLAPIARADDSEMFSPQPTINVWAAGKSALTLWGSTGSTNVSYTPFNVYGTDDPQPTAKYDDKDHAAGLRYAFPVGEKLTLEAGFRYGSGSLEMKGSPYTASDCDDAAGCAGGSASERPARWDFEIRRDEQERKNWEVSFGGLFVLPSGADSPIRGGLYFLADYQKNSFDWDLDMTYVSLMSGVPSTDLVYSGEYDTLNVVTTRVGLTADIHVIRDVLRVTPTLGYYYSWRSPDHGDSTRSGGASYGLELGYRPGGAEGRWEILFSPYFKAERRALAVSQIPDEKHYVSNRGIEHYAHRDSWALGVRFFF